MACTETLMQLKFQVKNDANYKRSNSPMAVFQFEFGHLVPFGAFGCLWSVWVQGEMEGCTGGPRSCSKMPTKNGKLKQINRIHRVTRAHCWVICMTAMELGVVVVVVGAERGKTLSLLGFCARTESLAFPSYWVCWYFREVIMLMFKWCLMDSTL